MCLSETELTVDRHALDGKKEHWSFQPNWLRVRMDDPPEHESQLTLTSHGRTLTIGAFLTPEERLEVAKELRAAIGKWRRIEQPA